MQNLASPEVSGGHYCDSNVNSETETYADNLIFMWQPITTRSNQEFNLCFISLISSSRFLYNGGDKSQSMLILPDELNEKISFLIKQYLK